MEERLQAQQGLNHYQDKLKKEKEKVETLQTAAEVTQSELDVSFPRLGYAGI
jgi:hypothetical protein